ncbi:hypothetical protein FA13DRAFT_1725843 [Coprinellus micaceus]|uniref:Zn(2)-C6 fungal-type domain-containing protein n=1 Tax=Coprinellus micaceus TaxID=71717 RepID=A0A4Y7TVL8_COPMI|nr:hypothetical protein FA13DRAFT_1725843 [Coprinellus micaceus]
MQPNPPLPLVSRSSFNPIRPILPQQSHRQHNALVAHAAEYQPDTGHSKKRRIDRACDACRRKKTRCDGPWTQGNICTNCIQAKKPCTYIETSKPRGPPKAYVVGLEDRVEELEALLAQISPGVDYSDELGPTILRDSWKDSGGEERQAKKKRNAVTKPVAESSRGASTLPHSLSSSSLAPESLPPLVIPFHQDDIQGASSPTTRTTHLLFKPRPKAKKRRSIATSDKTTSNSSGRSPATPMTGTSSLEHRSPVPLTSPADSTSENPSDGSDSDSEDLFETSLAGRNRFTLRMNEIPHAGVNKMLFHGRSSTAGLVEATRKFKHLHMQESMQMEVDGLDAASPESASVRSATSSKVSQGSKVKVEGPANERIAGTRRPQFWGTPTWELGPDIANPASSPRTISEGIVHRFPPPDLCGKLIDLYFVHCNTHFPLLNRPIFEQQWNERLQDTNFWFAATCLMLFAVASRWSTDERVLPPPEDRHLPDQDPHVRQQKEVEMGRVDRDQQSSEEPILETPDSHAKRWWFAGMTYADAASEVIRANANMFHSVSLFEVQALALLAQYLRTTAGYPQSWLIVSIGLRRAIDAGAHRLRVYRREPTPEDELWKRAFWHLVVFDRLGGIILGRSVGIGEEDFDLEFPLEIDDPYWGDEHGWKQPEGVPSTVSFFSQFIKLTQVIAFTSRTLYAINKTKLFRALIKGDWRSEILTQLNAALEECLEGFPAHLKWSKDISDPVTYTLSATLITTYYLTRLLIYRPFIPPPPLLPQSLREQNPPSAHSPASITFPALAICISAARACTRVLEHQYSKRSWEMMHIPNFINAAYVCAGLFLLALWDLKGQQKALVKIQRAGVITLASAVNVNQDKDQVQESEGGEPEKKGAAEDVDTEEILQALKEKMAELLKDIRLLIEALEWVESRWQNVTPWIAQLKQSLPQDEDLEERIPPSRSTLQRTASRKGSFQDLRRQRQQQRMKKPPQTEDPDDGLRSRSSHSSIPTQGPSRQQSGRSGSGNEPPDPALFIHENYAHLHTFPDEDLDDVQEQRIQLPRVDYDASPVDSHGPGPSSLYHDHSQHVRESHSSASPMGRLSPSDGPPPQYHDPHGRPPYQIEDGAARHQQPSMYGHEDYAHPSNVTLPYISSTVRRTSLQPLQHHGQDPLPPPLPQSNRMLAHRTPSFDDFHSDPMPHRFRPPLDSPPRPSISMDRSTIDEDRKPSLGSIPLDPDPRRYREDPGLHLGPSEDRRYQRPEMRADLPSPYSGSYAPEIELRYPWPSQGGHAQHRSELPSPYSAQPYADWKGHPQHDPQHGSGHPSYPPGFGQYQQVALPNDPQTQRHYQGHENPSMYARPPPRPGHYDHAGYHHGP